MFRYFQHFIGYKYTTNIYFIRIVVIHFHLNTRLWFYFCAGEGQMLESDVIAG